MITHNVIFKKLNKDHLELLHQWFSVPHILTWYARDEKYTLEMIQEKYLPRINDSTIPSFIIFDGDTPVGYIQRYHIKNHLPEGVTDCSHPLFNDYKQTELVGLDLFIADENYLHTGFSSYALKMFIDTHIKGKFKAIVVDPLKHNTIAILFFEKNGFKKVMSQDTNHDLMILRLR